MFYLGVFIFGTFFNTFWNGVVCSIRGSLYSSEVSFLSAGCINLSWSVSKTVHCRVLDLPGDKKNVGENRGEME